MGKPGVVVLFWFGILNIVIWIFTGKDLSGWLGLALMAPAFIVCIAQAMRHIERLHMHTFTRRHAGAGGISTECLCGFYYESAGRDASSRAAVMTAELQHKAAAAA